MTVVYAPANDMLHAFRAGPNVQPAHHLRPRDSAHEMRRARSCGASCPSTSSTRCGLRLVNEPQGRDNHVYMLARGIRFADVFVRGPADQQSPSAACSVASRQRASGGAILYFGRGHRRAST